MTEKIPQQQKKKISFCLRDVDLINEDLLNASENPTYRICSRGRQGISTGWGDTYFFGYAGQFIDITDFPDGLYRLIMNVNPESKLTESNYENNTSSVLINLEPATMEVEVLPE